jgi:hypothetical protein
MRLKEDYIRARCCRPQIDDLIIGYYSHENKIKVHKYDCTNLEKSEKARLITLSWSDILASDDFMPGDDFEKLSENDFTVLKHHQVFGVDYSLKVAAVLKIEKQAVFDIHNKLRKMRLLKRVEPIMIQYRKNVVKNKWIKHRNHTYYELTKKGRDYLQYFLDKDKQ